MSIATFGMPYGIAIDKDGNLYVSDLGFNNIRKITPGGMVSTLAGSLNGLSGSDDGPGTAARFNVPLGLVTDPGDNVFVVDAQNNKIRKITPLGMVTTVAGSGAVGAADGGATIASFSTPLAIAIDAGGNLYVTEQGNYKIRKITAAGDVSTFAGSGTAGSADGMGTAASFNFPVGIAIDQRVIFL